MQTFFQFSEAENEHGDFIRDESGKPVSYYHGTRKAFDTFQPKIKRRMQLGFGMHFATNPENAEGYTKKGHGKGDAPNIHKVHLRAKNVLDLDQMFHKDTHPQHYKLHLALHKGTGRTPYVSKKDEYESGGHFVINPDVTNPNRAQKLIQQHGFDAVKYKARELQSGAHDPRYTHTKDYPAITVFHPGQIHPAYQPLKEGTKFLYHGTSSKTLDAIKKAGLILPSTAGITRHWTGDHPSKKGVYVATRPEAAMSFAHSAAANDKSDPVVLKVHRKPFKGLKKDTEYTTKSAYYKPSSVSADAIAKVHNLNNKKEVDDLLAHPCHQLALDHGFKHDPTRNSGNAKESTRTYTRPGTQHQGKDYLHLTKNNHTNEPRWDFGMKSGRDAESLGRHLDA